jgi:hypothetical protein
MSETYKLTVGAVGDKWAYIKWALGHMGIFGELASQVDILVDEKTSLVDRLTALQEILEITKPTLADFPGLNASVTTNEVELNTYMAQPEVVGKIGDGKILEQIFKYLPMILQIISMFSGGAFPVPTVGLEPEPELE